MLTLEAEFYLDLVELVVRDIRYAICLGYNSSVVLFDPRH